jgi:hypothetical protein
VQTRLLACLVGGFLGVAVAYQFGAGLGLNPTVAFIGCPSLGIAGGYMVSILFDVFATRPEEVVESSAPNTRLVSSRRPGK